MAEPLRVLVVGGGVAGCAAIFRLLSDERLAGSSIDWVYGVAGASQLMSGALDIGAQESSGLTAPTAFAMELGWRVRDVPAAVPTQAGEIRMAAGVDAALMDLTPLSGKTIGLLDFARVGFDAEWLARSLTETQWAKDTGTRFFSSKVEPLRSDQRKLSDFDFARLLDQHWGEIRFKEGGSVRGVSAFLSGPFFGLDLAAVHKNRNIGKLPVGQTLSAPGGVAGARFEASRRALAERLTVRGGRARIATLRGFSVSPEGVTAQLVDGAAISASACILCTGGVVGGGLIVEPDRGQLRLSYELPTAVLSGLSLDESPLLDAGSEFGFDVTTRGLDALSRVGIAADSGFRVGAGFYVAGDAVAGHGGTVLAAADSGERAAASALLDLVGSA